MTRKQAKQKKLAHGFSLNRYAIFHWQAFRLSLQQLHQTAVAAFMTAFVIGIALALPAVFFVLLQNIGFVAKGLEKGTQISLFLNSSETTSVLAEDIMTKIRLRPDVASVTYISPEEGLHDLEIQDGLSGILEQLPSNPLPPVIEVCPAVSVTTPEQIENLFNALKEMPGIDSAKLDMLWVKRLHAILDVGKQGVVALGTLLALAVILVINHTIRLSTQNRHKEISVLALIGATRGFIRRPFLYTGMLYGSLGGLLAWLFVEIFVFCLSFPVGNLAELYHSGFELNGLSFIEGLDLIFLGLSLGWLGSWTAVNRSITQRFRKI